MIRWTCARSLLAPLVLAAWACGSVQVAGTDGGLGGATDAAVDLASGQGQPDAGPAATRVTVRLAPQAGVTGMQRVNFAVPLAPGVLRDASQVRVLRGGVELPAARRGLARYRDGSFRSVQLQADVMVPMETELEVRLAESPAAGDLTLAPVESTLSPADGTRGPRVWVLLPARWLSDSGVAGPQVPEADVAGTPSAAWARICDYADYDTDAFIPQSAMRAVWLFDRVTTMYRGYARRGDLVTLESAYREASIYRNGITGTGAMTRIGIPEGADTDLKYHYTQNLAIHYLLTGDDRFREAAEAVAARAAVLWPSPGYAGGADFWTERNAGFALLAYVWAMIVSDDRSAEFQRLADADVTAYLALQATYPIGYADREARCFAHTAEAHGEDYGYFGCSPWMSAILADGLDAYAGERGGAEADSARKSLVQLGRIIARSGRDAEGRPYYWMGVGTMQNEADPDDEHWGESAYIVAMAWHHGGRSDAALRRAADELVMGFDANDSAPHMRSFNWQCRSAVATPYYLK